MTTRSSSPVNRLLARYPDDVQALALEAMRLIRRLLPDVEESADSAAGLIAFGYGPGYKGMVCTLLLSKTGVKVGLVRGSELDDPRRLLAGSGKVHRHIQMKSAVDLRRPGVSALIRATYVAWRKRTGD
jgi:hypothetical protein